jgi:FlaA1/EpsC-like NDP-sugar epimerase
MEFFDKLVNWYFNKKSLPFWCIFMLDNACVFFSYLFVYQQFNSGKEVLRVIDQLSLTILLYTFLYMLGFRLLRTYSGILRYSSFVDLQRVGYAMLFGLVASYIIHFPLYYSSFFVRIYGREIISATILATLLLWGLRILVKTLYDVSLTSLNSAYVYIYGVRNAGIGIAKHIRNEKPMKFVLKGFVSDDERIEDRILMGVKVHKLDDELVPNMIKNGIEAIIVSPSKIDAFRENEKLQNELINANIHIYIPQEEKEWTESAESPQLKEISIEDLLPRDEIQVDLKSVCDQLRGKKIMITGSAGSIGSEMVRQISKFQPAEIMLIDQAETPQHDIRMMMAKNWPEIKATTVVTSITNSRRMEDIFFDFHPDYVFHAAAYKHVPMMEDNPSESVLNNILGTKLIADMSVKYGVKKFVMISTDKAVNPTNVMGCSKRICEIYVQSLDKAEKTGKIKGVTQFVTTRFGNVLGSNGSVIPLFKEQIRNGGPITVTDPEIIRYFMLIPEACKLVLEAGTKGNGGEIFVFDMGKPVKIADLAQRMIKLSGAKNIEIKYTGLRAGEKLYEETLNVEETTKPSFHEKIRIANVREYDYENVCSDILDLIHVSENYDNMQTVKKMKEIVPEYRSNNSIYDALDID